MSVAVVDRLIEMGLKAWSHLVVQYAGQREVDLLAERNGGALRSPGATALSQRRFLAEASSPLTASAIPSNAAAAAIAKRSSAVMEAKVDQVDGV